MYELLPEKSVIWIENLNKESVYKGLVKAKDILENHPEKANSMRDECRENAIENIIERQVSEIGLI